MTITPAIVIALCLICFVIGFLMSVFIFTHKPRHKERVFDINESKENDNTNNNTAFEIITATEAMCETEKGIEKHRVGVLRIISQNILSAARLGHCECIIKLADIEPFTIEEVVEYLKIKNYEVKIETYTHSSDIYCISISWANTKNGRFYTKPTT